MRVVVALGGNALLRRGQTPDADVQEANVAVAVEALVPIAEQHELVVTHGNGPQVGVLALQSASDPNLTTPYPFDVLGAQTQGMIGYWLLQSLQNHLPYRHIACIINQTLVAADDPAFAEPTKFIGEVYDERQAQRLADDRGWTIKQDGEYWRRVVGSPEPQAVVETPLISLLLGAGAVVVCAGGGGVPVVRTDNGSLDGVEAVVDKDHTASVLGSAIGADALLILTDVASVYTDFGTAAQQPIAAIGVDAASRLELPAGSMGPKVAAACHFVEETGGIAAIGRLEDAELILAGEAGTTFQP